MTQLEILNLCKQIAPKYGYDPIMVLAQVEQESNYKPFDPRLEEGYLVRYIQTDSVLRNTTPVVKALMATSFGYGQLMGHSLYLLGYFPAMDSISVAMKLDEYVADDSTQVETLCKWLKKKQDVGDSHTIDDALRRYNGSSDYPPQVYTRYNKLKAKFGG